MNCENLTTVGGLPETLINMTDCFRGCMRLVNAPQIPYGVIHMTNCFYNCTSLQTTPVIPGSVLYASYCFYKCRKLSGDVYIDATGYAQGQSSYAVNFTGIFKVAGTESAGFNIFIIVDFETSTQHYAQSLAGSILDSMESSRIYFMCKPQQDKSYNNGNLSILHKDSDNNVTTLSLPLETNASLVDVSIPASGHRGTAHSGEISTNLECALIDLYLQASERGSV